MPQFATTCIALFVASLSVSGAEFVPIFDGRTLKGWDGDPKFWRVEDGAIIGGAGSAVAEYLMSSKHTSKLIQLGLPDEFIMQGTQQEMYAELGLDSQGILAKINAFFD